MFKRSTETDAYLKRIFDEKKAYSIITLTKTANPKEKTVIVFGSFFEVFDIINQDISGISDINTISSLTAFKGIKNYLYDNSKDLIIGIHESKKIKVTIQLKPNSAYISDFKLEKADEPTGSLDSNTGEKIFCILKNLAASRKTVIIVTHNKYLAGQCDRKITMEDGRIS